jgi:hypothetical protein
LPSAMDRRIERIGGDAAIRLSTCQTMIQFG